MFSKFLRKVLLNAFQVAAVALAISAAAVSAFAQGGTDGLTVLGIEQVRAEMPQVRVYVREGDPAAEPEAYLDGQALAYTGTQPLSENGTSYLVMLDVSGSIRPDYFVCAKEQILALAQGLGAKDKITLIAFGDTVRMETSDCRDAAKLEQVLDGLQARDQNTSLYEAFRQCLKYADSTGQNERQIVLVISDGLQDTGSVGVTKDEILEMLTQANLPVYAFCVDSADAQSQEELGSFARATGGSFAAFSPADAGSVWQGWKNDLNKTQIFCFETDTNDVDGKVHTLLLKMQAGAQEESCTHQVRFTSWAADTTPPEVTGFTYDAEKNVLRLEFSEPVLGADKLSAYQLSRKGKAQEIKSVTADGNRSVQLMLPEHLPAGTYTLNISGVCDDSMEKNPLSGGPLTFRKAFTWKDALPFALGALAVAAVCAAAVILSRRKKQEQPLPPQKVEYQVQHVDAAPHMTVASPAPGMNQANLTVEIASGVQAGQKLEFSIQNSAIWGRSREMCDVSFDDRRISKQHCALEVQNGNLLLTDLGSQNGTYVNGIRIQQNHPIHPGDVIRMGDTMLRVTAVACSAPDAAI